MAARKFVPIMLVALLVALAQPLKLNEVKPQVRGLVADLLALLKELTDIVLDAIAVAVKTVLGLLDIVLSAAARIIIDLTKSLDSVVKDLLGLIDDLLKEAAVAGIDVAECIGTSEADIEALSAQFLATAASCLTRKVDEAEQKINNTVIDIESTANILVDLGQGIEGCSQKGILVQPICYAALSAEIALDIISVPLKISADVVSISAYITTFVPSLERCEVGVLAGFTAAGTEIVAKVTDCVNGKLNQ